ncbi:hypothetical protein [Rhizobium binxianense]
MKEYWDRWGWAVALVIIVIGFLRVVWGREAFCGPENEHCLREWISALGGWAAVAAAVPTILFLSRQVRDAQAHHRESMRIQLQKSYALAVRTERIINRAESLCDSLLAMMKDGRPTFTVGELAGRYQELMAILKSPEFIMFESEFAPPDSDDMQGLLRQLTHAEAAIEELGLSYTSDALLLQALAADDGNKQRYIGYNLDWIRSYLGDCRNIIVAVSAEYKALKG